MHVDANTDTHTIQERYIDKLKRKVLLKSLYLLSQYSWGWSTLFCSSHRKKITKKTKNCHNKLKRITQASIGIFADCIVMISCVETNLSAQK